MVNVVLKYENTNEMIYTWGMEESSIDFRKNLYEAERCTVSFAGLEIITFLNKVGVDVSASDKIDKSKFNVEIYSNQEDYQNCEYSLEPTNYGIKIVGESRTGALYGAYEFLKLQGFRWLNPWQDVIPENIESIKNIDKKTVYKPDMPLLRGFWFEGDLKESAPLWFWMARNRLNASCAMPTTNKIQRKLGMIPINGGHIFERALRPTNRTEKGEEFWDAHRDWYCYSETKEIKKERATYYQFCMSNEELFDYLAKVLINEINTSWYESDNIAVSTFDVWDDACMCENCKKLGNDTDKQLNFLSAMRKRINKAYENGEMDHKVKLESWIYEGTNSITPPLNKVPQNLIDAGDYGCFWPILRCYNHHFDEYCERNNLYNDCLKNWKELPMVAGEYYSVSKFEDLPILFTNSMMHDIGVYKSYGCKGMTYMHVPVINWGVRNLTQCLYAELLWNSNFDVQKFLDTYFTDRYGVYASEMKKAYSLIEEATKYISSWRSWDTKNILDKLMKWDGSIPTEPMVGDFDLKGKEVEVGDMIVSNYDKALKIIENCCDKEFSIEKLKDLRSTEGIVNPVMMQNALKASTTSNLEDDMRNVKYGYESFKMLVLFYKYYNALYNKENTDKLWEEIDTLAKDMIKSIMPAEFLYGYGKTEIKTHDYLKRSQLKDTYYKCKILRKMQ